MLKLPDYATARAAAALAEHDLLAAMIPMADDPRFPQRFAIAQSDAAIGRAGAALLAKASAKNVLVGTGPRAQDFYDEVQGEARDRACLLLLGECDVLGRFLHTMTLLAGTERGRDDIRKRIQNRDPLMYAGPELVMAGRFAEVCHLLGQQIQAGAAPGRTGDPAMDAVIDRAAAWFVSVDQPVPEAGTVDDYLIKLFDPAIPRPDGFWREKALTAAAHQRQYLHELADAVEDLATLEAAGITRESARARVQQRLQQALRSTATLLNAAYRMPAMTTEPA